jgi:general secretion pathway protein G
MSTVSNPRRRHRRRHAFTLMEVLLVLAILVILGSFVTVGYVQLQKNANLDAARSQIKMLESGVDFYALAIGTPPSTEQGLQALIERPSDLKNPNKWAGPYLKENQLPLDPWGGNYQYEVLDVQQGTFKVWSNGPDGQQGSEDDVDPHRDAEQNIQR